MYLLVLHFTLNDRGRGIERFEWFWLTYNIIFSDVVYEYLNHITKYKPSFLFFLFLILLFVYIGEGVRSISVSAKWHGTTVAGTHRVIIFNGYGNFTHGNKIKLNGVHYTTARHDASPLNPLFRMFLLLPLLLKLLL